MKLFLGVLSVLLSLQLVHGRPSTRATDSTNTVLDSRTANDLHGRHHHHHHGRQGGHQSGHQGRSRHHPRPVYPDVMEVVQLCGSQLSDFLRHLCRGRGYNTPDSAGASGHGVKGVSSECCHVGCSMEQLDKYCQPRKAPPQPASESALSTSSPALQTAHHGNHIRPVETSSASVAEESPTPMPTVLGGRVTNKLNITQLQLMDSSSSNTIRNRDNMFEVGTIPLPHQIPVTAVKRQQGSFS